MKAKRIKAKSRNTKRKSKLLIRYFTCEHRQYVGSSECVDDESLFNLNFLWFPLQEFCPLELQFRCVTFFLSRCSIFCSELTTHLRFKPRVDGVELWLFVAVDAGGVVVVVVVVVALRFHKDVVEALFVNERVEWISTSNSWSESLSFDDVDCWLLESTKIWFMNGWINQYKEINRLIYYIFDAQV